MMANFLSLSELARRANQPLSALLRLVRSGELKPDATISATGALLFSESRLPELLRALESKRHPQKTYLAQSSSCQS